VRPGAFSPLLLRDTVSHGFNASGPKGRYDADVRLSLPKPESSNSYARMEGFIMR
jgi:hypothetical protein